jgi:hypothetical protein
MARRRGDGATLAFALSARHWALMGEESIDAQLAKPVL